MYALASIWTLRWLEERVSVMIAARLKRCATGACGPHDPAVDS